ncbi:hypothetical protein DMUE_0106 [Dictyocoela muelleri]|nr:hypothetical protein DMUE_0106 [Dictyocoela muelleri]
MEITRIGKSALLDAIHRIETYDDENPTFDKLYKKVGRKTSDKQALHAEIKSIIRDDNSLIQKGCRYFLTNNMISISQLCREFKKAGLTRKRLKIRPTAVLNDANINSRKNFVPKL